MRNNGTEKRSTAHLEEAFSLAALPTGYGEQLQPERGADGKAQWPHPGSAQLCG